MIIKLQNQEINKEYLLQLFQQHYYNFILTIPENLGTMQRLLSSNNKKYFYTSAIWRIRQKTNKLKILQQFIYFQNIPSLIGINGHSITGLWSAGVRKSTSHITLGRLKRGTYMTHLSWERPVQNSKHTAASVASEAVLLWDVLYLEDDAKPNLLNATVLVMESNTRWRSLNFGLYCLDSLDDFKDCLWENGQKCTKISEGLVKRTKMK